MLKIVLIRDDKALVSRCFCTIEVTKLIVDFSMFLVIISVHKLCTYKRITLIKEYFMKFNIIIPVLVFVFTVSTECSLTDRLAIANEKISECRKNIGVSESSYARACAKTCRNCDNSCKSCSGCKQNT